MSPNLLNVTYEIAQILCHYVPNKFRIDSLVTLYQYIEAGRATHNKACLLMERCAEEWVFEAHPANGTSLFFVDAYTQQISLLASDLPDRLTIRIGAGDTNIFLAHVTGDNVVYRYEWNERLLTNETHISFMQLLDEEIFYGKLLDNPLKILPSYALH